MATTKKPAAKRATRAPRRKKPEPEATKITPRQLHDAHRWIRLDEVAHLPGNPNKGHEPSLNASIDTFGWIDGIVIHQGVIIAGNHRYSKARQDGEEGLPGYDLSAWPIDVARRMAMAIAHNRTGRLGDDDPELLVDALLTLPDELRLVLLDDDELADLSIDAEEAAAEPGHVVDGKTPADRQASFEARTVRTLVLAFPQAEYDKLLAMAEASRDRHGVLTNAELLVALLEADNVGA